MKGIVSRDLKPGNVLVRSDGHIVLTDFDLSLKYQSVARSLHFHPKPKRKIKIKTSALEFVAEPTDARCLHFIVRLSAVDWWTLGIFLLELAYGMTPFKGLDKDLIPQLRIKDPASEFGSSSMYTPAAI